MLEVQIGVGLIETCCAKTSSGGGVFGGTLETWKSGDSEDPWIPCLVVNYPVISVDLPYLSHVNHGGYKPLTKWDEPPSAFGLMASWGRNPVGVPWISLLRSRHFPDAANLRGGAGFAAATWVSKTGF